MRRLLVVAPLAVALAGCGPSREATEADRVMHALDAIRDAPPDAVQARLELVDRLANETATTTKAVAARDACAKAYRLLLEGKAFEKKVEQAIDAGIAAEAVKDLGEAQEKLAESAEAMPDCEHASAALRGLAR